MAGRPRSAPGRRRSRASGLPAATKPPTPEDEQCGRDRREQRRECEAVREQPAGRVPVDVEDPHDPGHPGSVEDLGEDRVRRPSVGRDQPLRSSNRTGWTSSTRTRRGAATRARTSPRRTNRRPPSLMLWRRPARAQPPIVAGREVDVRRGEDVGCLRERDPVGRRWPSLVSRERSRRRCRSTCAARLRCRLVRRFLAGVATAPSSLDGLRPDCRPRGVRSVGRRLGVADVAVARRSFLAQPDPL